IPSSRAGRTGRIHFSATSFGRPPSSPVNSSRSTAWSALTTPARWPRIELLAMRILVTGGAGFIGSHVADGFRAQGHEVAVVDNLSTGSRSNLNGSTRLYQYDIGDTALEDAFMNFRPDVVDHHAAQSNVPASVSDPVYDASVNVLGSLN